MGPASRAPKPPPRIPPTPLPPRFSIYACSKKRNEEFADKTYGPVLTLCQFLLIPLLISPSVCRRGKGYAGLPELAERTVPLWDYAVMAAYFVLMSILNNLAFSFNISQPMHMVFRSSNLMVTYVYKRFWVGERYSWQQLLSVVLLTAGALCATLAETQVGDTAAAAAAKPGCASGGCGDVGSAAAAAAGGGGGGWASALFNSDATGALYLVRWWMGIGILVVVLVLQTSLGALQEEARKKHGKAPEEMIFYFHLLSLPAFAFYLPSLPGIFSRWSASHSTATELVKHWGLSAASLAPMGWVLRLPIMWTHVALNCITQYICMVGVNTLISQADQLTVNVALTVRKFISLMLSIYVFGNKFTGYHWVGAVLVIGGSLYFSFAPKPPAAQEGGSKAKVGESGGEDSQRTTTPQQLSEGAAGARFRGKDQKG